MQAPSPPCIDRVRVRPGVHQPVAIWRPATKVATLLTDLRTHRVGGPPASPQNLTFGLVPKQPEQRTMGRIVQIHRPTEFQQPRRHTVRTQASGSDGGQGGSSGVPSCSGVELAAEARTDTPLPPGGEEGRGLLSPVRRRDRRRAHRGPGNGHLPAEGQQEPGRGLRGRQVVIDAEGRSENTGLCCRDLRITEMWTYGDGRLHRTASQQQPL